MLIKPVSTVALEPTQPGVGIRWLIAAQDGAPNYAMRVIEVEPGVTFAPHSHPWEHEIYVLEGQGVLMGPGGECPMLPQQAIFIPPDEEHGYRNTGEQTLKFICVIPNPK
ncbi:MAG TPA: cupin domain-containing protein [Anaerolineae bacterium]|nr:cupin domain-containing protein [Anaerolineae bacterium]HPD41445.1 cupin domain-containing protein [Anaerolineae bacterium]HRT31335.1 cupin domain-containing protein [Anaerolineae bacterium]